MLPVIEESPQPTSTLLSTTVSSGYRAVLGNKNFLALWIGQVLSQIADRIVFVVFIALIVHQYGTSDRYTSFLYIAFTIPAILLTAVAGVFVDRWPRRAVLVSTNLLRGALVALLPLAVEGSLWGIYGLAFFLSAATQFFVPAEAATIPMIVDRLQLLTANSLFTTTMMASVIFGFALGDPLINVFSLHQVHWSIATLFFMAAISLMFVSVPANGKLLTENDKRPVASTLKEAYENFASEMREGIDFIVHHTMVWQGILKLALLFSGVVALCILFVSFAKAFLYENPQVAARKFAYIIAISGVGMALGAILVGKYFAHAKRGFMVYGGFCVTGSCLLLLAFIQELIPEMNALLFKLPAMHTPLVFFDALPITMRMAYTYTLTILMGIGAAFIAIPLQALLHELIPEDIRGKVLGVQFTVLSTSSTLPVLLAGLGTEQFGVIPMLLFIGIPFVILGFGGLYHRWKQQLDAPSTNW